MKEHYNAVMNKITKEYIEKRVNISDNGCWECIQTDTEWYWRIQFWYNKKRYSMRAHRVSYMLYNKEDPWKLLVCHECDNPCCINPKHLWLWTHQQNMSDMKIKGRHNSWTRKKEVFQYSLEWELIMTFPSPRDAMRSTWIWDTSIWDVCNSRRKTAWWFKWSYIKI